MDRFNISSLLFKQRISMYTLAWMLMSTTALAYFSVLHTKNNLTRSTSQSNGGNTTYIKVIATGNGSGSDWDNAEGAADLLSAIETGGTVYIAEGTYLAGQEISITNDVCVIGGFPSTSTGTEICDYDPITYPTIIDGGGTHAIFDDVEALSIELKGLVLQNGSTTNRGAAFNLSLIHI